MDSKRPRRLYESRVLAAEFASRSSKKWLAGQDSNLRMA
jgi:hypothetical protein